MNTLCPPQTKKVTRYVVRVRELAVRFEFNLSGKSCFELVPDEKATMFDDIKPALEMVVKCGVFQQTGFTIEPLTKEAA